MTTSTHSHKPWTDKGGHVRTTGLILGAGAITMDHALAESKSLDIWDLNDNDLRRQNVPAKVHSMRACAPKAGPLVSVERGVW